jgi:hypothetical protein
MPQALRDQLEASSAESKRSLNAEIIARLEESLEIDSVLAKHAGGAPFEHTANYLLDLIEQVDTLIDEQRSMSYAAAADELEQRLSGMEQKIDLILNHFKSGQ